MSLQPSIQSESDRHRWLAFAGLVALGLLAFLPALRNGLMWNDKDYVTQPELQSLSGLARIWFEVGATEQYYPALHSAFWIEHRVWGDHAVGYHLINVLWHLSSACLFYRILRRLAVPGAWMAAALFAVHPVAVESVAWISEQKNTLSTTLYLAAALAYFRYCDARQSRWYAVASALFVVALMTKTVTATLPAALLVIAWWRGGRLNFARDVAPLLPWLVVGAMMGLFSGWVERHYIGAEGADFTLSLVERTLVAGRAFWFYLAKAVFPIRLQFFYDRWQIDPAVPWQYLFPGAAVALLAACGAYARRHRGPLAIVLLFGGALFPTLGFFNIYAFVFSFVADHWSYVALLPATAAIGAAWASLQMSLARTRPRANPVSALVPAGVLAAFVVTTSLQCRIYRDAETLYRETLARNPKAWLAHQNLGVIYTERGDPVTALREYELAFSLHPTSSELRHAVAAGHYNLAVALEKAPDHLEEAIVHYQAAVANEPGFFEARNNLGVALLAAAKPIEAANELTAAVGLRPESSAAHFNLGRALSNLADRETPATGELRKALQLDPQNREATELLVAMLAKLGRNEEAVAAAAAAVVAAPNEARSHFLLGSVLASAGTDADRAIAEFTSGLRLDPDNAEAHYNLANLLFARPPQRAEAIAHYEAAVRLKPEFVEAHFNLAVALSTAGRGADAIPHLEAVLRSRPDIARARELLERLRRQP